MIERALPAGLCYAEAFGDRLAVQLLDGEDSLVTRATTPRRREYATARSCAHEVVARLGLEPTPILADEHGAPCWPPGVVGSITHCSGYRACAGGRIDDVRALGIDAERYRPLPKSVQKRLMSSAEGSHLRQLRRDDGPLWETLLYCSKEAVYKAWYAYTGRRLLPGDTLVQFDPKSNDITAEMRPSGVMHKGAGDRTLTGRWVIERGLALVAIMAV
jgi:4'-phosphopantetheinyl transferase EntD